MDETDIPILKKASDLYRDFYGLRNGIPKQDRYALWRKCEQTLVDVLEALLLAGQLPKSDKFPVLEKASLKLNLLRVFIRLAKEIKVLDMKKYILLQEQIDEIGRMLGGWLKASKE
jgi:hypothetical protein